jgi:two-component system, chemotaxis family, CheB/CheR fusion protein
MRLGKIVSRKVPVDLRGVVRPVVDSATSRFAAGGRTLSMELPPDPVTVEGDAERLAQAVSNLLDNSLRHTSAGARVTVTLAQEGADAVLRVRDTGEGIREDLLPHVFELFVQGDGQRARAEGGLGIGLFLVARIAELHGGSVGVRSDGPGKGAEFFVKMPMTDKPVPSDPGPQSAPSESEPVRPLRVLAIEDNSDVGDQLAMLLRHYGHEVRLERTGESGIAAVPLFKPEVVLLDIGLPDLDGHEVARRIRRVGGFEHVAIIGLSGYPADERNARAPDSPFDEYLTKPVLPAVIKEAMAKQTANLAPAGASDRGARQ